MKIVHGRVRKDGSIVDDDRGSGDWELDGHPVEQVEEMEGTRKIIFDPPFEVIPTVTASVLTEDAHILSVWNATRRSVEIRGYNHSQSKHEHVAFSFIAIAPQQ